MNTGYNIGIPKVGFNSEDMFSIPKDKQEIMMQHSKFCCKSWGNQQIWNLWCEDDIQ